MSAFKPWSKHTNEDTNYTNHTNTTHTIHVNVFKIPLWDLANLVINGYIHITHDGETLDPNEAMRKLYSLYYLQSYKTANVKVIQ
jgi:hypothetical protein